MHSQALGSIMLAAEQRLALGGLVLEAGQKSLLAKSRFRRSEN